MFKCTFTIQRVFFFVVAVAISGWLVNLTDEGVGSCWTFNVIRNWQQDGFGQLHGRLVVNPGGYQAMDQPKVYAGHRAASLYPAFVCAQLLSRAANPLILYYLLTAAVVLWAAWVLLGRGSLAFLLATVMVLCPGFIRWQTTLDPNLVCALVGFPYCAFVITVLRRTQLTALSLVGLLVGLGLYSMLNWTTAFVQGMLFAALLVMREVCWRRRILYMGLSGGALLAVVVLSVASKMGHPAGQPMTTGHGSALLALLSGYTWGNTGYGLGLSTKTAVLRLLVTNIIGFLPLLLLLGWQGWRRRSDLKWFDWSFALPFGVAVMEILGLRNYFGHHPWMSCHFLLLGMVLSLCVWQGARSKAPMAAADGSALRVKSEGYLTGTIILVTGIYGLVILTIFHSYNANEFAMIRFVHSHTSRSAPILIEATRDPELSSIIDRLPLDRRVTLTTNLTAELTPGVYLLTANPAPLTAHLAATEAVPGKDNSSTIQRLLQWYGQHIAHRRPGDKMEVPAQLYLYESANSTVH
jgi:hypothetical protein